MDLLFCMPGYEARSWLEAFQRALPEAQCRVWQPNDHAPAHYAAVWKPPAEALRGRAGLKAVFNLGAGVDAILDMVRREPDALAESVPLIRLEDAGMAEQMVEYVMYAALRYMRRFDEYERQRAAGRWAPLKARRSGDFPIAVLGLGQLGSAVAVALANAGFPVSGWSRTAKQLEGVRTFAGDDTISACIQGAKMLVNLLPSTPSTRGLIGKRILGGLADGAYLVNVARGTHVVESDLIDAISRGKLAGAMLDVFGEEPLPANHAFWREPRISITPHVSALTLLDESVEQIAEKIRAMERGETVGGIVDRVRGY